MLTGAHDPNAFDQSRNGKEDRAKQQQIDQQGHQTRPKTGKANVVFHIAVSSQTVFRKAPGLVSTARAKTALTT